jgi:hypothetical protein
MFSHFFRDFLIVYASNLSNFLHLFCLDQQLKPLFMPTRQARSRNYAVYRSLGNKLAEAVLLPVYLARRRRKVDAADEDNEEGEALEADAEVQKQRKNKDAVAAMEVAVCALNPAESCVTIS